MKTIYAILLAILSLARSLTFSRPRHRTRATCSKKTSVPKVTPTPAPEASASLETPIAAKPETSGLSNYVKVLNMINVTVSDAEGKEYDLKLASDMDGSDIKRLVAKKWNYPTEKQVLNLVDINQAVNGFEVGDNITVESLLQKTSGRSPIQLKLTIKDQQLSKDEQ